jgi:pimeloyl-ACP methyl ester carboxylesterase
MPAPAAPAAPVALSRRSMLAAPALALTACATPLRTPPPLATAFVLVHGAWHGGWCWSRVVTALARKGYDRVYAQSLTGLGDRSHLRRPDIALETHVQDVVNLVEWENLDSMVLCGHSYAGMVITGATERLASRLTAIVYLDAFLPGAPNTSLLDMSTPASRANREALAQRNAGLLPPLTAEAMMVNPADRSWVDSKCTPHPFLTFQQGLPSIEAHERVHRKVYVRATASPSPVFDRIATERRDRPGWRVIDLPFGHDLMVDAPQQVADLLVAASRPA